jgi:hypothetical protein
MERYSVISQKFPREFILLQGTGCRWGKCTFCDYYTDTSSDPYSVNREVLDKVTGKFGVLDVINSGSCFELDEQTIGHLQKIVKDCGIHTLWFEVHWMYRNRLESFAGLFPGVKVKFRCGVETFDTQLRTKWNKGIPADVDASQIARYFQGVCLLCCTQGEDFAHIEADIETACTHFEYMSVNVFCHNSSAEHRDDVMVARFMSEIYPKYKDHFKIEILVDNTDLGVGIN